MFFRLICRLKPRSLDATEKIDLKTPGKQDGVIEIRRFRKEELDDDEQTADCLLTVTERVEPPRKVAAWLLSDDPAPDAVKRYCEEARERMFDLGARALRLLRWRQGFRGDDNPFKRSQQFLFSVDGVEWKRTPRDVRLVLSGGIPMLTLSSEIVESVNDLLATDADEPLAHALLCEAWGQKNDNPRSALVIGIAAAETAVKHYVAKVLPKAKWLVENVPSPPLESLINEYLPLLPARLTINGKVLAPPRTVIDELKRGVAVRNQVIHGRRDFSDKEFLTRVLKAVHDLLYLLDYYGGLGWAGQNIGAETTEALIGVSEPRSESAQ